jgi:hypothetical protein
MVEPLARGETARVTIGGVRERSARRQRRQAMLGTEKRVSSSHKNSTQAAECPPAINQVGEVPFSLCAGAIGAAVSTSTRRRCNRRRHDECS